MKKTRKGLKTGTHTSLHILNAAAFSCYYVSNSFAGFLTFEEKNYFFQASLGHVYFDQVWNTATFLFFSTFSADFLTSEAQCISHASPGLE